MRRRTAHIKMRRPMGGEVIGIGVQRAPRRQTLIAITSCVPKANSELAESAGVVSGDTVDSGDAGDSFGRLVFSASLRLGHLSSISFLFSGKEMRKYSN